MSPKYAMAGLFFEKSDIYSFGVLMLEIICRKNISRFAFGDDESKGLLAYVSKMILFFSSIVDISRHPYKFVISIIRLGNLGASPRELIFWIDILIILGTALKLQDVFMLVFYVFSRKLQIDQTFLKYCL